MIKKKHESFGAWAKRAGASAEAEDSAESLLIQGLRFKLSEAVRMRHAAERSLALSDRRLEVALALKDAKDVPAFVADPVRPRGRKRKSKNRALPVLMCSDWHVEERVDPATINGKNEYTPAIAQKRIEYLSVGQAWLINQWKLGWDIDEAVLWYGGDMITGYIHDELVESNELSPTEATLLAMALMAAQIEHLMRECKLRRLRVICNFGNHGRTTTKRRVSTGAKNSFEWLAYNVLAQRFAGDGRISFDVAGGAHVYADLYGVNTRFTHGDDVRYQGGVGGLSIPLRKACDSWDRFIEAPLTVIGHWHQFCDYQFAITNGSAIGYNPYALSIKARWEPPQQGAFLIDEEWGKRLVTPVKCDPNQKR